MSSAMSAQRDHVIKDGKNQNNASMLLFDDGLNVYNY